MGSPLSGIALPSRSSGVTDGFCSSEDECMEVKYHRKDSFDVRDKGDKGHSQTGRVLSPLVQDAMRRSAGRKRRKMKDLQMRPEESTQIVCAQRGKNVQRSHN